MIKNIDKYIYPQKPERKTKQAKKDLGRQNIHTHIGTHTKFASIAILDTRIKHKTINKNKEGYILY